MKHGTQSVIVQLNLKKGETAQYVSSKAELVFME